MFTSLPSVPQRGQDFRHACRGAARRLERLVMSELQGAPGAPVDPSALLAEARRRPSAAAGSSAWSSWGQLRAAGNCWELLSCRNGSVNLWFQGMVLWLRLIESLKSLRLLLAIWRSILMFDDGHMVKIDNVMVHWWLMVDGWWCVVHDWSCSMNI